MLTNRCIVFCCTICLLTSCVSTEIKDIKFENIEATYVPSNNLDFDTLVEVTPNLNINDPLVKLLKISFSTSANLVEIADKTDFHIGSDLVSCELIGDKRIATGGGYIYWGKFNVSTKIKNFPQYAEHQQDLIKNKIAIYSVISSIQYKLTNTGSPLYDLQQSPFDLCLTIRGGDMLGRRFVSNVVVIPKEKISAVLQENGR